MKTYMVVYFGAALTAMFAMPLVVRLARKADLMDHPGVRRVHHHAVPRIGGVALVLGFFALTTPVLLLDNTIGQAFREVHLELLALAVGACVMFMVGLIDDIRGVKARTKLACLLAVSLLVCSTGTRIGQISVATVGQIDLGLLSWPATILWIATITVGMNFIDGLDGLAGGIAAIVCGTIAVFALWSGHTVMAVLMLGLLGSLTGFLFFNSHPAKVFMGDGGSLFIGFVVGASSVFCQAKTSTFVGIAVPLLALGVPILDTFFTMLRRRIIDRRSIFAAEKGHLHHRLLARGLSHQASVFVIYGITLFSAMVGLSMLVTRGGWTILLFAGGIAFLVLAFKSIGSTRLHETAAAFRRNRAIAREAKGAQGYFEDAQLRMRESASFTDWWRTVCWLAGNLEFRSVSLWCGEQGIRSGRLTWRPPLGHSMEEDLIEVSLPVSARGVGAWRLKAEIASGPMLEAGGHRAALLGRLIDECPPPVGDGHTPIFGLVAGEEDPPVAAMARRQLTWGGAG